MNLWRHARIHIGLVVLIALAAIFFMRVRGAGGATLSAASVSAITRSAHAPSGGSACGVPRMRRSTHLA